MWTEITRRKHARKGLRYSSDLTLSAASRPLADPINAIVAMFIVAMYGILMDQNKPTTGSLIWHLAMRWRTEVDRAVARFALTHAQYSVLASLHAITTHGDRPTQRELADYTGLQPIYVSKLVRALEAEGYLTRVVDSEDSRAVRLSLTDRGTETITSARQVVRALDHILTAPIGGPDSVRTNELAETLRILLDQSATTGEQ